MRATCRTFQLKQLFFKIAIEQEKGKLAGQVETLNGKLSELENLKSDLEKELLELKRPAGGAQ
ncbi:hypothetical protein ACUODJ_38605, partial [Escherichia sp. HC-CC]